MRSLLLLVSLAIIFSSCYKDIDNTEVIEVIYEQPKTDGDTEMSGHVVDGAQALSEDYDIVVNGFTTLVPNTYFYIRNEVFHKQGQLVEAYKDGNLLGMAYPYLIEHDINEVAIARFPELQEIAYSESMALSDRVTIAIEKPSIRRSTGEAAEQTVIHTTTITEKDLLTQMGTSAYSKAGELLALNPSSGFVMNLSEGDQPLRLNAQMNVMIDQSANGKSLFVFHRAFEYWLEVGKIGEGNLSTDQTGYFLIADAEPGVYMEGQVEQNDIRVSYTQGVCKVGEATYPFTTTENGRWAAVLPEGAQVSAELYNRCNELISNVDFSSTTGITDQQIEVDEEEELFNLVTEVLSCDGDIIEYPSIVLETDSESSLHVFSESSIDRLMPTCGERPFELSAFDQELGEAGPQLTWSAQTEDVVGYLSSCNSEEKGYALLTINGEEKYYPYFNMSIDQDATLLVSHDQTMQLKFKGVLDRMYDDVEVNVFIDDPNFGSKGYYMDCDTSEDGCGFTLFNVTHYESSGGWLRVSLAGERLWMNTINDPVAGYYPIEGVIVIKI